jgi:hypothetical protein
MSKGFALMTQDATTAEQLAITDHFKAKGWGWWHWFTQGWLLVDGTGQSSVANVRDEINQICPDLRHFVFEVVPGSAWAGLAPTEWAEWFTANWKTH